MRKETSNQFTEGLVSDLNPISTPNTVLTDALNATLITYNGNEFSLQNDLGNHLLKNCKLKPNYIPVGIKEYGDILYIVSYNPLNKHVEIGSYPSPSQVESSKNKNTGLEPISLIGNIKEERANYSELVENSQLYIWTSDSEEDSKIYPGDEYCISEIDVDSYKYEVLEYFIVDSDRNTYNITDSVLKNETSFKPVGWQIPGWFGVKYRLATFDNFNIGIRNIVAPRFGEEHFDCTVYLNFQFKISDYLLLNDDVKNDISIKLIINGKEEVINLNNGNFLDWSDNSKILWINHTLQLKNLSFKDVVEIKAIPQIKSEDKIVIYDSFEDSYTFAIEKIGSYSDFSFAKGLWKFYVEDDSLYLEYDVDGPSITTNLVSLYYRVYDINKNVIQSWKKINNYSGVTDQNNSSILFDDNICPEDIYIFEFAFYDSDESKEIPENINVTQKLVITSKIFSEFIGEYSDFSQISFDEWINLYKNNIKVNISDISYTLSGDGKTHSTHGFKNNGSLVQRIVTEIDETNTSVFTKYGKTVFDDEYLSKLWNINNIDSKGIIPKEYFDSNKQNTVSWKSWKEKSAVIHCKSDITKFSGKLWDGFPKLQIEASSILSKQSISSENDAGEFNEKLIIGDGGVKNFTYLEKGECDVISNLRLSEEIPIIWIDIQSYNSGGSNQAVGFIVQNRGCVKKVDDIYNIYFKNPEEIDNEVRIPLKYSDDESLPNDISREINSLLGSSDFGIVIVSVLGGTVLKLRFRHDSKEIFTASSLDLKGFTYLCFRQNTVDKIPTFVEINDLDFWNFKPDFTGVTSYDIVGSLTIKDSEKIKTLKNRIEFLSKNMIICDKDNSLENGVVVNIDTNNVIEKIPIFNLSAKLPAFSEWMYNGYNLFNYSDRQSLTTSIGNDVCGKLFTGNITNFPEIHFGTKDIMSDSSIDYLFDDVVNEIKECINNTIKKPNYNDAITSLLKSKNGSTRGVYWIDFETSSDNNKLIDRLDTQYRNSTFNKLALSPEYTSIVNAYLKNDNDKIDIAHIDAELKLKWKDA